MDSQFKKIIMEKDQSFLNDMTTLDTKYNNVLFFIILRFLMSKKQNSKSYVEIMIN